MIDIDNEIQQLLKTLNQESESYVFGGYLRDQVLGITPSDVDITTSISIKRLEHMYGHYPFFTKRTTANGYELIHFQLPNFPLPIDIVYSSSPKEKLKDADYTLNAFYSNGVDIIDPFHGLHHIKQRQLNEVNINHLYKNINSRPFIWLRVLRMVALTGFTVSNQIYDFLKIHQEALSFVTDEQMELQRKKTFQGKYLIQIATLLTNLKLIPSPSMNELYAFYTKRKKRQIS